jgi:hypothetical protein
MIDDQHLLQDDFDTFPDLLAGWRGQWPEMGIWVLLPVAEQHRIPDIQAVCRSLDVPLMGAVFPALVSESGFLQRGAWVLRFNHMPASFLLEDMLRPGATQDLVKSVQPHLQPLSPQGEATPTVFLVFDALLPNIATCLSELFMHLGSSVGYSGVNAGSETFKPMPCLFDRDRCVGNGVLGFVLPAATRVVAKHGYPVSRTEMMATSASGNRVDFINGRPAFDVYREMVGKEYGIDLTHENFYDYAVHYPLGLISALDVLVRIPVAFNEDGSLFCVGEVPPYSRLWLLRAPGLEESDCVDQIVQSSMVNPPGNSSPLLAFYCAGRRLHFGAEDAAREIVHLQAASGAGPLSGALSLGEIATLEEVGFPQFHNACLVCARR